MAAARMGNKVAGLGCQVSGQDEWLARVHMLYRMKTKIPDT